MIVADKNGIRRSGSSRAEIAMEGEQVGGTGAGCERSMGVQNVNVVG
jgi:hypothetical protein